MKKFTLLVLALAIPLSAWTLPHAVRAADTAPCTTMSDCLNAVDGSSGSTAGGTLGAMVDSFLTFTNSYLVPLIFSIAFLVFLWGVFQYFIAGAANEEKRDKGKQFISYALIGFVVMMSVWGIVNLIRNTLNFDESAPKPPHFGA